MTPMAALASQKLGVDFSKLNLSDEDIARLLVIAGSDTSPTSGKSSKLNVTLTKPRVGAIDDTGVFTGFGARGEGTLPSSPDCCCIAHSTQIR